MLPAGERTLLTETLRPPPGFKLDRAIGTTYTLDLLALLTAPLAFTFFSWEEKDDGLPTDPLVLLEALRRNASQVTLFCQAGRTAVPRQSRLLFKYLEDSVVEATAPSPGASFHPKVWVIRYEGADGKVRYRLIVLSRNLTFDRSWDTVLALEGELTDRTYAYARNHPLGDFVECLPDLALRPLDDDVRDDIERIQREVRRVDFELPQDFNEVKFWPLGIDDARTWPFEGRIDRLLVVSPFLSDELIRRIAEEDGEHILVSRNEELAHLARSSFSRFESVFAMSRKADLEERDSGNHGADRSQHPPQSGLHAKLFVADAGWDARVWTGSANGTNAAFSGNVEFLVELQGKKSNCGVDEVLGDADDPNGLRRYLKPASPPDDTATGTSVEELLDERLRDARRKLATAPLTATVQEAEPDVFRLRVERQCGGDLAIPNDLAVKCWPIMLQEDQAEPVDFTGSIVADFGRRSIQALTSFFAFQIIARAEDAAVEPRRSRFVLNLPLEGAPEDRQQRALKEALGDPDEVLRFLILLLQEEGRDGSSTLGDVFVPGVGASSAGRWDRAPLLETLLRVLDRSPERLDELEEFLADLRSSDSSRDLLPERLNDIWEPIWRARQELEQ